MIFQHTWQTVLDGKKTQTRRIVKPGEELVGFAPGMPRISYSVIKGNHVKWKIGRTYAVQPGRGKKAVGRIRITDIRQERLRNISHDDIEAEGIPHDLYDYAHEHRAAFWQLWDSIYAEPGTRWGDNPVVWVLEFEGET